MIIFWDLVKAVVYVCTSFATTLAKGTEVHSESNHLHIITLLLFLHIPFH